MLIRARHARSNRCSRALRQARSALRLSRGANERGNTLVEFALLAMLFIFLTMGILEFGRAIWAHNSLSHAAREGARYAIVRGSDSGRAVSENDVRDYVRERVGEFSPLEVTTTWQQCSGCQSPNEPGSVVEVKVDYTFDPIVPLFPSIPLTSTSKMVISF